MGCEEKGCLGFAHDGIGLGLELEHQAQVCDRDGFWAWMMG